MNDYLAKPYSKDEIVDIARRWTKARDSAADDALSNDQTSGLDRDGEEPALALSA